MLGWDQSQARTWDGICRHTALAALAQLRQIAIRNALCRRHHPPARPRQPTPRPHRHPRTTATSATLTCGSPSATRPSPPAAASPARPGIAPIRLSVAETARLAALARQHAAGLITRARLAFALRWSARRRRHQAIARWHHYSARLLAMASTGNQPRPEGGDAM